MVDGAFFWYANQTIPFKEYSRDSGSTLPQISMWETSSPIDVTNLHTIYALALIKSRGLRVGLSLKDAPTSESDFAYKISSSGTNETKIVSLDVSNASGLYYLSVFASNDTGYGTVSRRSINQNALYIYQSRNRNPIDEIAESYTYALWAD